MGFANPVLLAVQLQRLFTQGVEVKMGNGVPMLHACTQQSLQVTNKHVSLHSKAALMLMMELHRHSGRQQKMDIWTLFESFWSMMLLQILPALMERARCTLLLLLHNLPLSIFSCETVLMSHRLMPDV